MSHPAGPGPQEQAPGGTSAPVVSTDDPAQAPSPPQTQAPKLATTRAGGTGAKAAVKTIEQYADAIMSMIATDMAEEPGMERVRCFTDLEGYRDANVYMIRAGVPFDLQNDDVLAFYVSVQDAVTARLRERRAPRPAGEAQSPPGPRSPDQASGGISRPAAAGPAGAGVPLPPVDGDGRLILLASSDHTVYVFADRELAGAQHLVCVGANVDVEVLQVSPAAWAAAEHRLRAADPRIRIVDTRPDAGRGPV